MSYTMQSQPRWTHHSEEFWQNVIHWRRGWQTTSVFLLWEHTISIKTNSVQFSSVAQSYLTLCDPMTCSTPGFPVHHQLPELQVGDAIQPSHPLLSPSPPAFRVFRVFSSESVLHIKWPKYWSFSFSISPSNEYSGLISFRIDWLDLLAVQRTLKSLL